MATNDTTYLAAVHRFSWKNKDICLTDSYTHLVYVQKLSFYGDLEVPP